SHQLVLFAELLKLGGDNMESDLPPQKRDRVQEWKACCCRPPIILLSLLFVLFILAVIVAIVVCAVHENLEQAYESDDWNFN
ncbi:hypothetical protein PENTCL1PPCAC_8708, partial [Pristionchus entomophagus]